MKIKELFKSLTLFEKCLWISSLIVVTAAFLLSPQKDYLTLSASLLGVTALIFIAKGYVIGQIMCVGFAVLYGIISFYFKYYGEMITYLCMSTPIAVLSVISWLRHPYRDSNEVEVNKKLTAKQITVMLTLTAVVTLIFYFILKALGTANLIFSTISVATSFLASYLTLMRSPFYGLAYASNDSVLIVLWVLASVND
ncbi:MAG: nicotinamide mononucleotide transporter, partial [Clostridia bacterium]|nr:nicotinamide mononucleotide transporter [Clostridia bacterium]